jgi:hypothetical protein
MNLAYIRKRIKTIEERLNASKGGMLILLLLALIILHWGVSTMELCYLNEESELPPSPFNGLFDDESCMTSEEEVCCGLFSKYTYKSSDFYSWEKPFASYGERKNGFSKCQEDQRSDRDHCCTTDCTSRTYEIHTKTQSDGLCDAFNNNPNFNYDGGDCCPQTCNPSTRPFPCGIGGYDCKSDASSGSSWFEVGLEYCEDVFIDPAGNRVCRWTSFPVNVQVVNISQFDAVVIPSGTDFRCSSLTCSIHIFVRSYFLLEPGSSLTASTIVIHGPNLTLSGSMNTDSRGFRGDSGPGRGAQVKSISGRSGGGGGYGGQGGCGRQCGFKPCGEESFGSAADISGGPRYGDDHYPRCFGSGGGTGYYNSFDYDGCPLGSACAPIFVGGGGAGGGRVAIFAHSLTLSPTTVISAQGGDAEPKTLVAIEKRKAFSGGGGSGGSIWIHSKTILFFSSFSTSKPFISVNGGSTHSNDYYICDKEDLDLGGQGYGGAGGGGRISLITNTLPKELDLSWFHCSSGSHPFLSMVRSQNASYGSLGRGSLYIGKGPHCTTSSSAHSNGDSSSIFTENFTLIVVLATVLPVGLFVLWWIYVKTR